MSVTGGSIAPPDNMLDEVLARPASSPCLPRDWAALTNDDIGGTPHMRFFNAYIKFLYLILSQYAVKASIFMVKIYLNQAVDDIPMSAI